MFMELIKDVMLIELWYKETRKYAVNFRVYLFANDVNSYSFYVLV